MGDTPETVMNTRAGAHALLKNGKHLANNRVATILELRNVGLTIRRPPFSKYVHKCCDQVLLTRNSCCMWHQIFTDSWPFKSQN